MYDTVNRARRSSRNFASAAEVVRVLSLCARSGTLLRKRIKTSVELWQWKRYIAGPFAVRVERNQHPSSLTARSSERCCWVIPVRVKVRGDRRVRVTSRKFSTPLFRFFVIEVAVRDVLFVFENIVWTLRVIIVQLDKDCLNFFSFSKIYIKALGLFISMYFRFLFRLFTYKGRYRKEKQRTEK